MLAALHQACCHTFLTIEKRFGKYFWKTQKVSHPLTFTVHLKTLKWFWNAFKRFLSDTLSHLVCTRSLWEDFENSLKSNKLLHLETTCHGLTTDDKNWHHEDDVNYLGRKLFRLLHLNICHWSQEKRFFSMQTPDHKPNSYLPNSYIELNTAYTSYNVDNFGSSDDVHRHVHVYLSFHLTNINILQVHWTMKGKVYGVCWTLHSIRYVCFCPQI